MHGTSVDSTDSKDLLETYRNLDRNSDLRSKI
jgi:hypothetical protein